MSFLFGWGAGRDEKCGRQVVEVENFVKVWYSI